MAGERSPAASASAGAPVNYPSHTQVKICGFTRVQDAVAACDAGADAIGLVFYPPSSRNVDPHVAAEIVQSLPPFVTVTALFLNAEKSLIDKVLQLIPLSLLQFHGTESPEFCEAFDRPYIKSIAMKTESDVFAYAAQYEKARGFLLDSNMAGAAGGSGETFDWSLIPTDFPAPLVLAGGLDMDNVYDAVVGVKPAAVDVSSGVESSKGIKEPSMMHNFIQSVRSADRAMHQSGVGEQ